MPPELLNVFVVDELTESARQKLDRHKDRLRWRIIASEDLAKILALADGLILRSTTPFRKHEFERASRLKAIVMAGTGLDHIDCRLAQRRGIFVASAAGANAIAAAEHTIALMLGFLRHTSLVTPRVARGAWSQKNNLEWRRLFRGTEIAHKKVGIIGLGRVGQRVAKRLKAFEADVMYVDPLVTNSEFKRVSLQRLLSTSDIISLHAPLTARTKGLLKAKDFALCKQKPLLVNTARGALINEGDLVRALTQGRLRGYAADVFAQEPLPRTSPLLKLKNVLLSPHLGAQTREAQDRVNEISVQRLLGFLLDGEREGGV